MPVFQCCRRQKRFCPKWLRMIEDTLPRSPRWPAMWALANWSITVQVNSQRWVCFIYPIPCSPPLYHELSIITGWLWWGFEAGAGSPWTYEHPNHLHLPLLHPGHWHVRRRECQVSAIQPSNDPTSFPVPRELTFWLGKWLQMGPHTESQRCGRSCHCGHQEERETGRHTRLPQDPPLLQVVCKQMDFRPSPNNDNLPHLIRRHNGCKGLVGP